MGIPVFKIRNIIKTYKVHVYSSNYTLYGDMSQRVMDILSEFTPDVEIYSIDEAFLDLTGFKKCNLTDYGYSIRSKIKKADAKATVPEQIKTIKKIINNQK